jgi:hypothetical protein
MNRSLRLPLALVSLSLLAACVVNVSFALTRPVPVTSPASGTIALNQAFDLLESKEVVDHKANIKSLDLDYAEVTVTTVNAGNHATVVSGTVKLQKTNSGPTQEVTLGTLTSFAITQGNHTRFSGSPAIDAFLMSVLNGDGKFTAVVNGSVDGATDIVLNVDLHASVGYDAGIL